MVRKTVLVSGLAVRTLYYYKGNPYYFYIWAGVAVTWPFVWNTIREFAKEHTVAIIGLGGTLLTICSVAGLYKLDILPEGLLTDVGLAGFTVTAVATLAAWISEFSLGMSLQTS